MCVQCRRKCHLSKWGGFQLVWCSLMDWRRFSSASGKACMIGCVHHLWSSRMSKVQRKLLEWQISAVAFCAHWTLHHPRSIAWNDGSNHCSKDPWPRLSLCHDGQNRRACLSNCLLAAAQLGVLRFHVHVISISFWFYFISFHLFSFVHLWIHSCIGYFIASFIVFHFIASLTGSHIHWFMD